jgi:hypothetical protein
MMAGKANKTWKNTERAVAKILGGKRVPITGRNRGDAPDVAHIWLSIEVKHRKQVPEWIKDAMSQAVASQRGEQLPVVILHEQGQAHKNDLVIIRLGDFQEWFGDLKTERETGNAEI